jgi:arylsulfatase A
MMREFSAKPAGRRGSTRLVCGAGTCVVATMAAILAAEASQASETPAGRRHPNIVLIMADDLGIDAVPAYGGRSYAMPNIDRLAAEGIRFNNFHANPFCTPSRSELLTGRYPFRTGTPRVISDMQHREFLDPARHPCFARQLQKAGYKTAIAGKWQLSFLAERDTIRDFGFDTYLCWQIVTADNERTTRYRQPHFRHDGTVIADRIKDRYGPDVMCDFLIDFIKENRAGPFLAYYPSLLPHFPWVPTPDSEDQTTSAPELGSGTHKGDAKFFPDMVAYLDKNVGRLLKTLDELGIAENTIVIFMADNGTDQGIRSQWNDQWVDGGKNSLTDRATRVPLLIRWPGRIEPGSTDDGLVECADMLPTLCDLAGVPHDPRPIDGVSFASRIIGHGENGQRESDAKPWVHIQRAADRYLRSDRWIVSNQGVLRRVRPYPIDPPALVRDELADADLAELDRLGDALRLLDDDGR